MIASSLWNSLVSPSVLARPRASSRTLLSSSSPSWMQIRPSFFSTSSAPTVRVGPPPSLDLDCARFSMSILALDGMNSPSIGKSPGCGPGPGTVRRFRPGMLKSRRTLTFGSVRNSHPVWTPNSSSVIVSPPSKALRPDMTDDGPHMWAAILNAFRLATSDGASLRLSV